MKRASQQLDSEAAPAALARCNVVRLPGTGHPQRLIRFRFERQAIAATAPASIRVPMRLLAGGALVEDWLCAGPITRRSFDGLQVSAGRDYAVAWLSVVLAAPTITAASADAYERLGASLTDLGYDKLVRTWNFIPEINVGRDDSERYRQFCLGRGHGLDRLGIADRDLPAATAVGLDPQAPMILVVLASRGDALQVENPRQTSAFRYPRSYGPRSPSFARATLLGGRHRPMLLASGTASIRGHASLHSGDLGEQIRETTANLEALIEAARRLDPRLPARLGSESLLRAYLRRSHDLEQAERLLSVAYPGVPIALLQADICRRELDVEIEAVLHG